MQKRKSLILDDAYYNFNDPIQACGYVEESYGHNRGDSIEWARQRCNDDEEIRKFVFNLRCRLRERLMETHPIFPFFNLLEDAQDPNHFFVFVGQFADANENPALKEMARFICQQLKNELNLDLHQSLFVVERPHNSPPPNRGLRLPS